MPQQVPLRPGDPRRLGRYRLGGRIDGIPSDDPVFIGLGPDGHEVAISLLRGDWAHDGAARDRFAAEAAVAKRVPPFCAARVLDAGLDGQDAYLVSEYVPGPSLLDLVAADGVRRGHELDAVAIAMATGLASVHQAGLVHGNFGPEYVIMAPDGPPRVIEYGITPPYGAATPSADMLAWAQTVVFAAAGHPPGRLDDLDVLPEHVRRTVEQCLDPEPAERPAARAVVLNLLGDGELPGGVLAEGARRAARAISRAAHDPVSYRAGAGTAGTRLPQSRQARSRQQGMRQQGMRQQPDSEQDPYSERGHGDRPAGGARSARRGGPGHAGGTGHSSAAGHGGPRYGGAYAERGSARSRSASHDGPSPRGASPRGASPRGASRGGAGRGGGGRRTVWLVAAAVVVVVVAGGLVLHVALGSSGNNSASHRTSQTVSKTASPSASISPSPSQGPVTPANFAGSWSGQVKQPPTDTYNVRVTLRSGATSGSVSYTGSDFSCSGTLQLLTASTQKLTFSQGITQGQCENGTVTFSRTGSSSVWFRFRSSGPVASGTLDRS